MATPAPAPAGTDERATVTLPVEGMTCAACQAHVSRALTGTPGVERATVNLMTNEATVVYDPRLTSPHVPRRGGRSHGLRRPSAGTGDDDAADAAAAREPEQARESRTLLLKSLVSLALGADRHGRVDAAHGRRRRTRGAYAAIR